jgi:hypothetical protein
MQILENLDFLSHIHSIDPLESLAEKQMNDLLSNLPAHTPCSGKQLHKKSRQPRSIDKPQLKKHEQQQLRGQKTARPLLMATWLTHHAINDCFFIPKA